MKRFLTFDDVGLVPKFNKILSRLHTDLKTQLGRDSFKSPFIPANMDSVIGPKLAQICKERGAPIIFHRFAPIEEQVKWTKEFPEAYMSLGVQESSANLEALYEAGCRRFCIDIAHGHSQVIVPEMLSWKQ